MSDYQDQTIVCADCEQDFLWGAGEQQFFHEKGFTNPPKRCKECRQANKDRREKSDNKGNRK